MRSPITDSKQAWGSAARSLWLWIPPALLGLYIKQVMLVQDRGFRITARALGRIEHIQTVPVFAYDSGLTVLEKLSFYRADLLLTCFATPIVLLVIARALPPRWSFRFFLVCSGLAFVILAVQLRALSVVGRFLSYDMLWKALQWGWQQREARASYLTLGTILPFGFTVVAVVVVVAVSRLFSRRAAGSSPNSAHSSRGSHAWIVTELCFAVAILVLGILGSLPRIPKTPLHTSVLYSALSALWNPENAATQEFSELTADQLLARYQQLTNSPIYRRDPRYWGTCRNCNLIYFILETGAARFLPTDDPMDDLPNLRRLRDRSFIANNHFSTYPHTVRAHFSIVSSWYDSDTMKAFIEQYPNIALDGVARRLTAGGYQASAYFPRGTEEGNDFRAAGFTVRLPSPDQIRSISLNYEGHESWMKQRIIEDTAALRMLESDINNWLSHDVPFVASFAPDAGHHPWPDYDNDAAETSPPKRARAVLRLQDAWIGELMQILEQYHQLDNTLIVITGDHGVRTRAEDNSLPLGTIDEYSYHVPLFIYAPKTLNRSEAIAWMTSHIDITPTLYDLLGIERGSEFLEGSPIWEPLLAQRTTFLFGLQMIGADGFQSKGKFYMWNRMSGAVYANTKPHFDTVNLVLQDSTVYHQVTETISRMAALQQVLVARRSDSGSLRSHLYDRSR
jgi:hypothetical protein